MSPRSTFQSCGISSSCDAFSQRPKRVSSASVRRTSSSPRYCPMRSSAPGSQRAELEHREEAAALGRRARRGRSTGARSSRASTAAITSANGSEHDPEQRSRRRCRAARSSRSMRRVAARRTRAWCSPLTSVSSSCGGAVATRVDGRPLGDEGPRNRPRSGRGARRLRGRRRARSTAGCSACEELPKPRAAAPLAAAAGSGRAARSCTSGSRSRSPRRARPTPGSSSTTWTRWPQRLGRAGVAVEPDDGRFPGTKRATSPTRSATGWSSARPSTPQLPVTAAAHRDSAGASAVDEM